MAPPLDCSLVFLFTSYWKYNVISVWVETGKCEQNLSWEGGRDSVEKKMMGIFTKSSVV